ncbi:MAG: 2-amino-4-hydroxy-6-hydroxymethyldihydropteridine diphosphokinase [Dehalococcoidia bacterium]|nr:2-amino-4-hydroxy-6-hydroxymethyldihydropteridine diphosphokinase [Dehalococcoidia bacterium]
MTRVVIALGANLGDRLANLRAAVHVLQVSGVAVDTWSSVWETPPVPADQPAFLNAVIAGETALDPEPLLDLLKQIEWERGRRPSRRWGPRPIDLDILFYGDSAYESERLTIPHPRIAERGFVLVPLAEVVSDPLPVIGRTALELLAQVNTEGIIRIGEALAGKERGPAEMGEAPR